MMPWKTKTASNFLGMTSLAEEQRSDFRGFAFCGCLTPAGIGGSMTSMRMTVCNGSSRSCFARIWPMKPAAPVMRICIFVGEKGGCDTR